MDFDPFLSMTINFHLELFYTKTYTPFDFGFVVVSSNSHYLLPFSLFSIIANAVSKLLLF